MQSLAPPARRRAARARRALALLVLLTSFATAALAAEPGLTGVVNVNTATGEQLAELPGIGESKARAILEARVRLGGFEAVDDLLEVPGIGEKALERIRPYVAVQGRTTLESH